MQKPDPPSEDATIAQLLALLCEATEKEQLADEERLLAQHAKHRVYIRKLIWRTWGQSIDALTHLVIRCLELGRVSSALFSERGADDLDHALAGLWARGCQIGFAICTLLEEGFADDAHARWRTLHEVNVVAQFLRQHGNAMAARYFAHLDVKNYKNARTFDVHAPALGYQPVGEAELQRLKARRDAAVALFPQLDDSDWGWTAPAFQNNGRVNFTDIQASVGLDKWRAHVGMAHHNVHAGAHGAVFRLGNPSGEPKALVTGPSPFGLGDPGHSCGISLVQLTLQVALPRRPEDRRDPAHVAAARALLPLLDRTGSLFAQAHLQAQKLVPVGHGEPQRKSGRKSSRRPRK